jgi:hypothetical protein
MSTRGTIAIKELNGEYTYIYNHHDSYLDGVGIILKQNYMNVEKVKALINLGSLSSIGVTIEENSKTYKEHLALPVQQRGTVAYFRDVNRWEDYGCSKIEWEEVKPSKTNNINEVCGNDFTYVFDTEKNQWFVAYWETYNNEEGAKFYNLNELIHNRDLLDEFLGENYYVKEYKEQIYQKLLNA